MQCQFHYSTKYDFAFIPVEKLRTFVMNFFREYLLVVFTTLCSHGQKSGHLIPPGVITDWDSSDLHPSIFVAILARNKAHTLPYFLTLLQDLDYPKDRMAIWIKSDHNEDATAQILRKWGKYQEDLGKYHSTSIEIVDSPPFRQIDQQTPYIWSSLRYQHIMRLKTEALKLAQKVWADYIWFLDADAFILNNQTLKHLISKKKDLIAPMLLSGGMYSNFWGGMQNYYYVRTEEYKEILEYKKSGCFPVPLIHSAVLANIRKTSLPNFNPVNDTIPEDDIIRFAISAQSKNLTMHICNDLEYGYIMNPGDDDTDANADLFRLQNLKTEIATYWANGVRVTEILEEFVPPKLAASTMGFDEVFVINLKRRPDRLAKMDQILEILGIDYTLIEAVDGKELNQEFLEKEGITQLEGYQDPYSNRVMTFGEIGCFLSHYKVWKHMIKFHVNTALILEDDVRFEPYFTHLLAQIFEDTANIYLDWDLIYLGRKRSHGANESWVEGTDRLVYVDYTYWTLGYALTLKGAKKLIAAEPLKKLVPVDEFLPIMFNRHRNQTWMNAFPTRDLKAFSAEPLLLYPSHYTSEPGYISDTEKSSLIVSPDNDISSNTNCSTTASNSRSPNSCTKEEL